LAKEHPESEFLQTLSKYRDYAALHPENLKFDPRDNSARMYLKQNVVGGGRLSGAGGEFERDGGFELNPQGVKKLEPDMQWRVYGNVLDPDEVPADQIESHEESYLHPKCFKTEEETVDGVKQRITKKAPGIINNHIGMYQGYAICLVPKCTSCAENLAFSFPAPPWMPMKLSTQVFVRRSRFWLDIFHIDYSNIEVRAAANLSGEPELQKIFLGGRWGSPCSHSLQGIPQL